MALEASKPCIQLLVGGASLAGKIDSPQCHRARAGPAPDYVLHHICHNKCVARVEDAFCPLADNDRLCFPEHVAPGIFNALDEVRGQSIAAIGEYAIAHNHFEWCG